MRDHPYLLYEDPEYIWCLLCAGGLDIEAYASSLQRRQRGDGPVPAGPHKPHHHLHLAVVHEAAAALTPAISDDEGHVSMERTPFHSKDDDRILGQDSFERLLEGRSSNGHKRLSRVRKAFHQLGTKKLIIPHTHDAASEGASAAGGARIVHMKRTPLKKGRGMLGSAFDPVSEGCVYVMASQRCGVASFLLFMFSCSAITIS